MSVTVGAKLGLLINADIGEPYVDYFRPFLRAIDELLFASVINSTTTTPPSSPANGDAYLLLGSPTGAWAGHPNQLAIWSTEITTSGTNTKVPGWEFKTPNAGWLIWDVAATNFKLFSSGSWGVFSGGGGGSGTVTSVTSADANATVATTTSTPIITIVSAPKLTTAHTINGVGFDGTANITVPAAAGTLTGSTLASGVSVPVAQVTGLATVATTGAYSDLTGKPSIPSGTVTSVSSADANATVATGTSTPVITIVSAPKLATARTINGTSFDGSANITVTAAAGTLTGSTLASGVSVPSTQVTGLATSATTDTTNATNITSGTLPTAQSGALSGDVTKSAGSASTTVTKVNGTSFAALATGILKNTTSTGVPSIAIASDFPTLNQNTTGSAATLTTPRAIAGHNFDGSAAISIASTDLSDTASIALLTSTQTLTNKRVTKRTGTTTSSATPTINTDNVDFYSITALAAAITSFTTNLSGTPTEGQTLWIAITDNGTARAISWGTSFESSTVALPTTTVVSTRLDVGFVWNTVTSKWRCIATS